jgi:hypothetical protein
MEMTPNANDCDYSPDELLKIWESTEMMIVDRFEDDKTYRDQNHASNAHEGIKLDR